MVALGARRDQPVSGVHQALLGVEVLADPMVELQVVRTTAVQVRLVAQVLLVLRARQALPETVVAADRMVVSSAYPETLVTTSRIVRHTAIRR